jgi:hypothetical protein
LINSGNTYEEIVNMMNPIDEQKELDEFHERARDEDELQNK